MNLDSSQQRTETNVSKEPPFVEAVNTLHYGINQGEVPADMIVFYVGMIDTPITVIELG